MKRMTRIDEWGNYHSPNICFGGGSSSPSGSTTTTQNTSPWIGQQPFLLGTQTAGGSPLTGYLPDGSTLPGTNGTSATAGGSGFDNSVPGVLPLAASLYENYSPQYYPGTTYQPENASQSGAIAGQESLGLGGSPITGAANAASQNILGSNFLNSNPGNAAYQDILNGGPQVQAAVANATPGLLDSFTQGNRLNSPSAAYGVGQGIGNAVAGLEMQAGQGLSQNYASAAGQQNTATALAPQTQGLAYTDLSNAYNAGATQQGLGQNTINDALARYNYNQTLPYNLLNAYSSAVGGSYGTSSALTSPYFTQQSGGLTGALGGAASGAALGSAFAPGIGTAAGGVLGALLGGLA